MVTDKPNLALRAAGRVMAKRLGHTYEEPKSGGRTLNLRPSRYEEVSHPAVESTDARSKDISTGVEQDAHKVKLDNA